MRRVVGERKRLLEATFAWSIVLLFHLLLAMWLFRRADFGLHPSRALTLELSYLERVPLVPARPEGVRSAAAAKPAKRRTSTAAPVQRDSPVSDPATNAVSGDTREPLDTRVPDIALLPRRPEIFQADIFSDSKAGARWVAPPERFRMRAPVTARQIVRDFGKLVGLWPPGYTDDPCPAIRRLAESGPSTYRSEGERQQIADAILVRQRFCM